MYNKFYFLHIPKTSGRFCKENIIVPLTKVFDTENINYQLYPSHANWDTEFIDQNTYIFTIFRDPIVRTVSHYAHDIVLNNEAERVVPVGTAKEISRNHFIEWLEKNQTYISDFQSKNFLIEDKNKNHEVKNFFNFNLNNEDKENIFLKIKRTNLMIKPINLNKRSSLFIQNKVLSDFNLDLKNDNPEFYDNPVFYNEDSKNLFNMLNEDDIEFIKSINKFDLEIYNNSSLFLEL